MGSAAKSSLTKGTLVLFLLALSLRLAAATLFGFGARFGDAEGYVKSAEVLLETGAYPDNVEGLPVFRAPGYPLFLAAVTLGHPRSVPAVIVANALLGALAVLLAARLGQSLTGSDRAGAFAGLLAACDPALVLLSTDVQSECFTVFLLLLFALSLVAAWRSGRARDALAAGILLGASSLVRPSCLALAPLLPLAPGAGRARLRRVGAALAGLTLALAPWTLRNFMRFGAALPVNDQGGVVFWLGNTQLNADYYALRTSGEYQTYLRRFTEEVDRGSVRRLAQAHPNPADRSRAFLADATEWIRAHPSAWARLLADKTLDWLRPWANPLVWSPRVVVATGLWNILLFGLAAVGLTRVPRGVAWAAVAWLALSAAVHVAMIVVLRYRATFWDPVLVVLAGAAMLRVLQETERRERPEGSLRRVIAPTRRREARR